MSNKTPKAKKTPSALKKVLLKLDNTLALTFLFGKLMTFIGYVTLLLTFLPMTASGIRTGAVNRKEKQKLGDPTNHLVFGKSSALSQDLSYFQKHPSTKEYTNQFHFNQIINKKGTAYIANLDDEGRITNQKTVATYSQTDKIRPMPVGAINGTVLGCHRNEKNEFFLEKRDNKNNLIQSTKVENVFFTGIIPLNTKKLRDDVTMVVVQGTGDPLSPGAPKDTGYIINSMTGEMVKALAHGGEICPSASDDTFFLIRWDSLHKTLIGSQYDKQGSLMTRTKFEMDYSINSNQFSVIRLANNNMGVYAITTAINDRLSFIYRTFYPKGNPANRTKDLQFDLPRGKVFKFKGETLRNDEHILTIDYEAKKAQTNRIFLLVKQGMVAEKKETIIEKSDEAEKNNKPYSSIFPSPHGNKGFFVGITGNTLTSQAYAKNDLAVKSVERKQKAYLPETEYNLIENFKTLPWEIRKISLQVAPVYPNMTVQDGIFKIKSDYVINNTFTVAGQLQGESNIARYRFRLEMLPEPFKFGENTYEIGLGDISIPINVANTHPNYPPTFSAQALPKGIQLSPNGTLSINGTVIGEYQLCDKPLFFNVTGEDGYNPPQSGEVTLKIRCGASPWTTISLVMGTLGLSLGGGLCFAMLCFASGYLFNQWQANKPKKEGEKKPLLEDKKRKPTETDLGDTGIYATQEEADLLGEAIYKKYEANKKDKNMENYFRKFSDDEKVKNIIKTETKTGMHRLHLTRKDTHVNKEGVQSLANRLYQTIHKIIYPKDPKNEPEILTKEDLNKLLTHHFSTIINISDKELTLLGKTKSFKVVPCQEVLSSEDLWSSLSDTLEKAIVERLELELELLSSDESSAEKYDINKDAQDTLQKEIKNILNTVKNDHEKEENFNYDGLIKAITKKVYTLMNDLVQKKGHVPELMSENEIDSVIAPTVGLWVNDAVKKDSLASFRKAKTEEIEVLEEGKENESQSWEKNPIHCIM